MLDVLVPEMQDVHGVTSKSPSAVHAPRLTGGRAGLGAGGLHAPGQSSTLTLYCMAEMQLLLPPGTLMRVSTRMNSLKGGQRYLSRIMHVQLSLQVRT